MRLSRISLGSQASLPLLVSLVIRVQDRTTQVYLRARKRQTLVLANDEVEIRQLLKDMYVFLVPRAEHISASINLI